MSFNYFTYQIFHALTSFGTALSYDVDIDTHDSICIIKTIFIHLWRDLLTFGELKFILSIRTLSIFLVEYLSSLSYGSGNQSLVC